MRKIRILHIGLSSNLGGIEKYLINIYRNIDRTKFQIDFLVFKGKKVCFYDEISKMSEIYEIPHRKENYIKYLVELKRFFKKSKYDYIHIHLMEFSCFERITYARKYTNAKIILHSHIANHEISTFKTRILNELGKKIIKKNDVYLKVACSESAGEYMFDEFPLKKFKVLNNGVDIKEFEFDNEERERIRKKYNIEGKFVIGNIGRLVRQKNHDFLIDVIYELKKYDDDIVLMLIGKGPLKENLAKKIERLNLERNIVYVDNTNEVNNYMYAMDIFAFTSFFEGLGIVLIEAQAAGLYCIITDTLPKEVDISENVVRISLNESAKEWAKKILEYKDKKIDRKIINKQLLNSDFEIKNSIKILEQYYINNLEEK